MPEFNSMTVTAACRLLEPQHSVASLDSQLIEWNIFDRISGDSKPKKLTSVANFSISNNPEVMTKFGKMSLCRAIIEAVLKAGQGQRDNDDWRKLVAGLRFDGFEITGLVEEQDLSSSAQLELRRMLPADIPGLDFREAENELSQLLNRHDFIAALGHMSQAISAFSRGDWAASNAQIRTFYQSIFDTIAENLGCDRDKSDHEKRQYLADNAPEPFLLNNYNEWENNKKEPSYVRGLWARLHTEGSHPGLSDEDDCAFRLQTVLITARLFMRRFDRLNAPGS